MRGEPSRGAGRRCVCGSNKREGGCGVELAGGGGVAKMWAAVSEGGQLGRSSQSGSAKAMLRLLLQHVVLGTRHRRHPVTATTTVSPPRTTATTPHTHLSPTPHKPTPPQKACSCCWTACWTTCPAPPTSSTRWVGRGWGGRGCVGVGGGGAGPCVGLGGCAGGGEGLALHTP